MWYLKQIDDKNSFQVIAFLKQHEPICVNLCEEVLHWEKYHNDFSDTSRLHTKRKSYRGDGPPIFLFFHDMVLVAVFALDRQGTLLHCFPKPDRSSIKAFVLCARSEFAHIEISSIMGERRVSRLLQKYLSDTFGYRISKVTRYFLLTRSSDISNYNTASVSPATSPTKIHAAVCAICTVNDIDDLLPLQLGYEREELERTKVNEVYSRLYLNRMLEEQIMFQCRISGRLVSKLHTNAQGIHCKQFGGVYTLEQFRGQHIAEILLTHAIKTLSPSTNMFALFVKEKNMSALRLYKRLGFSHLCDFRIISFK